MTDTDTAAGADPDADEGSEDRVDDDGDPSGATARRFPRTRADTVIDAVVGFVCVGVATAWTFDPLRVQFRNGNFANFFDLQARAFLHGNLAIEPGALGFEAFVRDGSEYMYFGPLLAVFRMPLALVTDQWDGRLTLISLLIGTLVLYFQAIKLFDIVFDVVHPVEVDTDAPRRLERWLRLGWRLSVAMGTVVLTLLAIPWTYHEAHLWSAAMFIALLNQMLLFLQGRARVWVLGLVLFAVGLNRPTTAYAGMIGIGCLIVVLWIRGQAPRQRLAALGAWSAAALVTTVGVNYAKFRRPFGIPMEDQVFSTFDANRARMLEIYDNRYFQLEFIPSNLWAYFRPNGVDLSSTFPFIGIPRAVPWVWGDAFYDATYRTASVTATNPLLVIAAIVGVIAFVRLFRSDSFWTLTPPVIAGLVAGGGVAGWGYMATRYLTDFLPGLLLLAAIGLAAVARYVARREEPLAPRIVAPAAIGAAVLVAWSILANLAIAFSYSFSVGDSEADVARLLSVQDAVSSVIGPDLEDRVIFVETLPYDRQHPPAPGTLAIVGDCEALYYSNGEPVDSWIEVEYGAHQRRRVYEVTPTRSVAAGDEIELVLLTETADLGDLDRYWFRLVLRVDQVRTDADELEYSLVMRDNVGEVVIDDLGAMPLDEPTEVTVTFDHDRRRFVAELGGSAINGLPMDPIYESTDPGTSFRPAGDYLGFSLAEVTPETPWCDRLASAATP